MKTMGVLSKREILMFFLFISKIFDSFVGDDMSTWNVILDFFQKIKYYSI